MSWPTWRPAPSRDDLETLVLNNRQQSAAWSHFQKRIADVECVIMTGGPDTP